MDAPHHPASVCGYGTSDSDGPCVPVDACMARSHPPLAHTPLAAAVREAAAVGAVSGELKQRIDEALGTDMCSEKPSPCGGIAALTAVESQEGATTQGEGGKEEGEGDRGGVCPQVVRRAVGLVSPAAVCGYGTCED